MTRAEIETVVGRFTAGVNAHDPQQLAALYVEDAVSRDVGRDMALMGSAAVAESLAVYFDAFPDVEMTSRRISADGDTVYHEWHATMTHTGPYHGLAATGRYVEIDGCSVFTLDARGAIVTEFAYWDLASMLRQLGLMAAWASEGATTS